VDDAEFRHEVSGTKHELVSRRLMCWLVPVLQDDIYCIIVEYTLLSLAVSAWWK
jgi:hypothetical protein